MAATRLISGHPDTVTMTAGTAVVYGDLLYNNSGTISVSDGASEGAQCVGIAMETGASGDAIAVAVNGGIWEGTASAAIVIGGPVTLAADDDELAPAAGAEEICGFAVSAAAGDGSTFQFMLNLSGKQDSDT